MAIPTDSVCLAETIHHRINTMEDSDQHIYDKDFYMNYEPDPSDMLITAEVLSSLRKRFLSSGIGTSFLPQQDPNVDIKPRILFEMAGNYTKNDIQSVDKHSQATHFTFNGDTIVNSGDSSLMSGQASFGDTQSVFSPALSGERVSPLSSSQASPDSSMLQPTYILNPQEDTCDTNSYSYSESPPDYVYGNCSGSTQEMGFTGNKVNMSTKKNVPSKMNHMLPPCRVCGDKASGFHYGANTCEACKGFFRRSLKKDTIEYKCGGNNQCIIQKGRRNNCPLCRYNKCLSIGMSKTAIKTGRYTHEKRTKDIVEVKQLSGDFIPLSSQCKLEFDISPPKSPPAMSRDDEKLLARIFGAHKILFPFWHRVLEGGLLQTNMINYAAKYKLKKPLIKVEEPDEIDDSETTKMDDDIGKASSTIKLVTNHLELVITVFVKFAKVIPGFCDLVLNDQAALVKLSKFEVWMVGAHKFFNSELDVVSGPRGNSYHRDELSDVIGCDFVDAMFAFSKSLQVVELSNEETALLQCVVLTFSDRSELHEPEKIDEIQQRLVSCLESLVNSVRRFSQIMSAIVNIRGLTEQHELVSEKIILNWPTIKRHPLLLEVMAV